MTDNPPRWNPDYEPFDITNCKDNYILKYRKPVLCPHLLRWGKWFQRSRRCVRRSYIKNVFVSTVFLGIDHNHSRTGDPILFETIIGDKNGMSNNYQTRCCTWREALVMHWSAVQYVKKEIPND